LEEKAVPGSSRIIPSSERRLLALTRNRKKTQTKRTKKKKKTRDRERESKTCEARVLKGEVGSDGNGSGTP
jgi:hypothetical protein